MAQRGYFNIYEKLFYFIFLDTTAKKLIKKKSLDEPQQHKAKVVTNWLRSPGV